MTLKNKGSGEGGHMSAGNRSWPCFYIWVFRGSLSNIWGKAWKNEGVNLPDISGGSIPDVGNSQCLIVKGGEYLVCSRSNHVVGMEWVREGGRGCGRVREAQVSRPFQDLALTLNGTGDIGGLSWGVKWTDLCFNRATDHYNRLQKDKGESREASLESFEIVHGNDVLFNRIRAGKVIRSG